MKNKLKWNIYNLPVDFNGLYESLLMWCAVSIVVLVISAVVYEFRSLSSEDEKLGGREVTRNVKFASEWPAVYI